jgi:ferredoxin
MLKVRFFRHNIEINVADGEIRIRTAMWAGVHVSDSCGREGVCGKCRVVIENGSVEGGFSRKLSRDDQQLRTVGEGFFHEQYRSCALLAPYRLVTITETQGTS